MKTKNKTIHTISFSSYESTEYANDFEQWQENNPKAKIIKIIPYTETYTYQKVLVTYEK